MYKYQDELTVADAAKVLGVHESTLNKWLSRGRAPFVFRKGRRIVRSTVVDKIEMAMARHGHLWYRNTTWTPADRFEVQTITLDKVPVQEAQMSIPIQSSEPPSIWKRLAAIAKELKEQGMDRHAAQVSLIAVEIM